MMIDKKHLLQTIFLFEKLEISFINIIKSKITSEKVIQANWVNLYCIKLLKIIKISFPIASIITHHLLNLFIDTNDCICQFNHF